MMTLNECAQFLQERDNFCILTHRRPDGDTLGSAGALCRGLRLAGKQAWILNNPEAAPKYAPLIRDLTVEAVAADAVLVSVDVAAPSMLPEESKAYADSISLRIDHHATATSFAANELVDASRASCAEIIYDVLCHMGVTMDAATAEAVYTGAATDTGCFRFSNTSANTHRVAAACIDHGAQVYPINKAHFDTVSLAKLRLQGWMAENSRFSAGGKVAVCALPGRVERQLGVTEDDMESISGFPQSIEGVVLSAVLRELDDGRVKISMRAVPGYDVAKLCREFGGGGHVSAAGATVDLPLEQAAAAAEQALLGQIE